MREIVRWSVPENSTRKKSLQVSDSVSALEGRRFQLLTGREEKLLTNAAKVEPQNVCYPLGHKTEEKEGHRQR